MRHGHCKFPLSQTCFIHYDFPAVLDFYFFNLEPKQIFFELFLLGILLQYEEKLTVSWAYFSSHRGSASLKWMKSGRSFGNNKMGPMSVGAPSLDRSPIKTSLCSTQTYKDMKKRRDNSVEVFHLKMAATNAVLYGTDKPSANNKCILEVKPPAQRGWGTTGSLNRSLFILFSLGQLEWLKHQWSSDGGKKKKKTLPNCPWHVFK